MGDSKRTLVLFPGSWGNRNKKFVRWWFRHVINHFSGWNIVLIHYTSLNLKDYIRDAARLLDEVPDGAYAICYSAGAQVARGVAAKRPNLFKQVVLFSGLERRGVRVMALAHALLIAFKPLWRVLLGGDLILDTKDQIGRIMLSGTSEDRRAPFLKWLTEAMHPEPFKAVRQLSLPPLRKWQRPFTCPVLAIVPDSDFFIAKATYQGEDVQFARVAGDHSLIASEHFQRVRPSLERIERWLDS